MSDGLMVCASLFDLTAFRFQTTKTQYRAKQHFAVFRYKTRLLKKEKREREIFEKKIISKSCSPTLR